MVGRWWRGGGEVVARWWGDGGEVVGRWWREGGEIMGRWYGDPACDEDEGGGEGGEQRAGASECGHSGQQRAWSGLGLG